MKLRLPLYARILGLFLLNVLLLLAAFFVVFRMQFHLGFDSFLASQANQRVRALSQVVIRELQESPTNRVDDILIRFSEAYEIELYVFNATGSQLSGSPTTLPREISRELRRGAGTGRRGNPPGEQSRPRDEPPFGAEPPPNRPPNDRPELQPEPRGPGAGPQGGWRSGLRRQNADVPRRLGRGFFLKSTQPTRYWAGSFFFSRHRDGRTEPHVLLIASDSISGGGLFFDFRPWIVAGSGGLILSVLLWLPFVRSITRSVRQMTHATERISVGQFNAKVSAQRSDELGELAEAINSMSGRLEGFVSGQRRFLGDIAHELCSPLARIQTALGILEQRANENEQSYVKDLQEEAQHMSELVAELLSFSKASLDRSKVKLEPTHLWKVISDAVRREQESAVEIQQEIPKELNVLANPELLQRAVANLLRNAIRYASQSGAITVKAMQQGASVILEVSDHGPGVPEESIGQLFDPFYRVDESRTRDTGGVGLGMTIVKTCVESCQGTVTASNRPEGGLVVQIRLKSASN